MNEVESEKEPVEEDNISKQNSPKLDNSCSIKEESSIPNPEPTE